MGPPKLMIPHLATTQPLAAAATDRAETSERPGHAQSTSDKEEKLEGEATISALDELTRALKNEPSPLKEADKEREVESKEDAPEEEQPAVDPLSWAEELASLTQVMTEN